MVKQFVRSVILASVFCISAMSQHGTALADSAYCGAYGNCYGGCYNECAMGDHQCSGTSGRTCANFGACYLWENYTACDGQCYSCGDGTCNSTCGESQTSCPRDCGYGSDHYYNYQPSYICDRPSVNAGPDKDIDVNGSVRLDGSITGSYDSLSWSCDAGNLSNSAILQPIMNNIYSYSSGGQYSDSYHAITCTLTARNGCGSSSDTVVIRGRGQNYDYDGNYGNIPSNIKVALIAKPKTGCAPVYGVDLEATVSNCGGNTSFTYYFDCDNDGAWEKTVTTNEAAYIARDLCSYGKIGSYTARVRVETRGRVLTDTDIVKTDDCGGGRTCGYPSNPTCPSYPSPAPAYMPYSAIPAPATIEQLSIQKLVSNLSDGTQYQTSVTARPMDVLSYKITVTGQAGFLAGVIVRDALPAGITGVRDLKVDGVAFSGDIKSGINIGNLAAGQTRMITYTATVATGSTATVMNNAATAYSGSATASASATVNVYRSALQAAMGISTGFLDNNWLRVLIAALSLAGGLALIAGKTKLLSLGKA